MLEIHLHESDNDPLEAVCLNGALVNVVGLRVCGAVGDYRRTSLEPRAGIELFLARSSKEHENSADHED